MSERHYDAFLSYSYAVDGPALAPAVQQGLSRLAKPWYRAHALHVFRDQTGLEASPGLGAAIEAALGKSRFFILMASPESAESVWVGREVEHWRLHREQATFLIVLTSGTINWDEDGNDFDWKQTTALPKQLSGWFEAEPLWVNLSWARYETQLSVRHSRFRSELATLAAPIHGKPKEALDSEDVRLHRSAVRARQGAIGALAVLTIIALVLGLTAARQQTEAEQQRDRSLSRELAARSETIGDTDPALARLLSLAAWKVGQTPQARVGMMRAAALPSRDVVRLGQVAQAAAYSSDGRWSAVVADGRVYLKGTDSYRELDAARVLSAVFNPDGSVLALGTAEGEVRLWRPAAAEWIGAPLRTGDRFIRDGVGGLAFHPDGRTLAVGLQGSEVALFDTATGDRIRGWGIGSDPFDDDERPGAAVLFGRDGNSVVTASTDGTIRFWDPATGSALGAPLDAHVVADSSGLSPALALSDDGKTLVSAGIEGTLRFWDFAQRTPIGAPVTGYTREDRALVAPSVAVHPDSSLVATGSQDGTIRLWRTGTSRQVGTPLAGHTRPVTSVAFSPDGRTLASTSVDGTVRHWDIGTHHEIGKPLSGFAGPVYSLLFSESGATLVTGGDNGGAVYNENGNYTCQNTGFMLCSSNGHMSIGPNISHSLPDANEDLGPPMRLGATVRFIDVGKRAERGALQTGEITAVTSLAAAPDRRIAIGGIRLNPGDDSRGGMMLWDGANSRSLGEMTGRGQFRASAFTADGTLVTGQQAASEEPSLGWWDTTRRVTGRSSGTDVLAIAVQPSGKLLVSGGTDGVLRWWDGGTVHELTGHTGVIGALAFSPDGTQLASAGEDGVVRIWDVATRALAGEQLLGHTGPVYSVTFSPDGRLLATGSGDSSVRIWDLATRGQVSPGHLLHDGPVRAVRFSPDGRTLASAGDDSAVRLWDVGYAVDVEKTLCAQAGRALSRAEWAQYVPDASFQQVC
ncbi:hypothetical protein ACIA8G_00470 [Lentzea sp. NPDC051213]|uniref:WD40 domain-containing protein n=1 Tax=Lentzea sp. NPDC051213 TaxID=3364126 RepID=UPI0037896397